MSYSRRSNKLNRRIRRKFETGQGISILSLVDILTILLVFLIKNVSLEVQKYTMPNNMRLPVTMEKRDLLENKGTTVIQVFPDKVLIGEKGTSITLKEFETDSTKREQILKYLQFTAQETLKDVDEKGNPKTPAALLIQADRTIPCWYITELVKLGTSSFYQYIYFATLVESDWLNRSESESSG